MNQNPGKALVSLLVVCILLAIGAGWWLLGQNRLGDAHVILLGCRNRSDFLELSGGNLVVRPPRPGFFFGTVHKPGQAGEINYLVIFRYDLTGSATDSRHSLDFHCHSDGKIAETNNAIELGEEAVQVKYRIELDDRLASVVKEELWIAGEPIDRSGGRVFLLDLREDGVEVRQIDVELPGITEPLATTEDVEKLVEVLRSQLGEQDEEIAEFLR